MTAFAGKLFPRIGKALGDQFDHRQLLPHAWLAFILGRHFAQIELIEDFLPQFLLLEILDGAGQEIETPVGLLLLLTMAIVAIFVEKIDGHRLGRNLLEMESQQGRGKECVTHHDSRKVQTGKSTGALAENVSLDAEPLKSGKPKVTQRHTFMVLFGRNHVTFVF